VAATVQAAPAAQVKTAPAMKLMPQKRAEAASPVKVANAN
jgi:hypothetical protein